MVAQRVYGRQSYFVGRLFSFRRTSFSEASLFSSVFLPFLLSPLPLSLTLSFSPSPPSFSPFIPLSSFFFLLRRPTLRASYGIWEALWALLWVPAEPDRQTVLVHPEVKNNPLVCGDSGVEEVHRRTSVTSQKVDQNFGGVGHPIWIFGVFGYTIAALCPYLYVCH